MKETYEQRFWNKVDVRGEDDCWLWKGFQQRDGYGTYAGERAHRVAYRLTNGNPLGLVVRHVCDTPTCCNPKHLLTGTHADNTHDRVERGRSSGPKGEMHRSAILDEAAVLEIRRLHAEGKLNKREQAERYGVTHYAIYFVVIRKTWKHI
jgi:HNH endonuclease